MAFFCGLVATRHIEGHGIARDLQCDEPGLMRRTEDHGGQLPCSALPDPLMNAAPWTRRVRGEIAGAVRNKNYQVQGGIGSSSAVLGSEFSAFAAERDAQEPANASVIAVSTSLTAAPKPGRHEAADFQYRVPATNSPWRGEPQRLIKGCELAGSAGKTRRSAVGGLPGMLPAKPTLTTKPSKRGPPTWMAAVQPLPLYV